MHDRWARITAGMILSAVFLHAPGKATKPKTNIPPAHDYN